MFNGFSHSVIGQSHVLRNLVCQDSSSHEVNENYAVAVVADGHGSKKHFRSHIGSASAVEATLETIAKFYKDPDDFEKKFLQDSRLVTRNIEKQILCVWNDKIMKHLEENPITREERGPFTLDEFDKIPPASYYGTTLIVAVMGKNFSFGFQIGDGSLVAVYDDGETVMPIEDDESAPANVTASICNSNAIGLFKMFRIDSRPLLALFTSTDGLYTSFGSDNDFLDYHTIIASQLPDIETFEPSIVKNMTKRTHFGTEDDISFSCAYNKDLVAEKAQVLVDKVAENKQKAAERKAKLLNRM